MDKSHIRHKYVLKRDLTCFDMPPEIRSSALFHRLTGQYSGPWFTQAVTAALKKHLNIAILSIVRKYMKREFER